MKRVKREQFDGVGWMVSLAMLGFGCIMLVVKTLWRREVALKVAFGLLLATVIHVCEGGDQVEMQNGDRYAGRLVAFTNEVIVLQSDVLGTLRLPKAKVATITLGPMVRTNSSPVMAQTNSPSLLAGQFAATNKLSSSPNPFGELANNPDLVKKVQQQFLVDAGPEANQKFNELVGGLMNGSLNVSDIRKQAVTAADQIRTLKRELGEDTGFALDGYLAILDNFIKESAASAPVTNSISPTVKSKGASGVSR